MASINEILGKNIDSVKALKAEIKSLQDSLVGLDSESQEFKDTSLKLAAAQEELTKVTRAGKEENVAAADSIRGMEKEYKSLYDTYKMLSEEQRNSGFGKEMASQLESLSTKLNETKQGVGNFKDNIGRYASSVTEAFSKMGMSAGALQGPLKAATTGVNGFGTSLKALAANPVVLVITALVAILAKAAAAIKQNEELTNRLKEAMSVFKPILDGVSNVFNALAGILVKTVEGLTKVAEKVMSIIPGLGKAIQSHKELAAATNELTKAQREANVENSKKEAEIERLREEASETENVVEKKKLLEEAKAMQAEIDQKNIELAQEELRIMEEYAEKTANSAEENEKLAAAQQKVNQAIAQGERNMRQYNKQISQVEKSTKSAGSSTKNYREEATKLYKELYDESKTEIQITTDKYSKQKALLEKYHLDTTLLTKKYEKDISAIRAKEIDRYLDTYKGQLSQMKKEQQLENELFEARVGRAKSIEKEIKKLEENLNNSIDDLLEKYFAAEEKVSGPLQTVLADLYNNGVFRTATDFEGRMNSLMNQLSIQGGNPAMKQAYESAIEALKELGEEGWKELTKNIETAAAKIEEFYGITVGTGKEAELQQDKLVYVIRALKKELQETFGSDSAKRIKDFIQESSLSLLKDAFSLDPSMYNFEEMVNFIKEGEYSILEQQKTMYEQELAVFSGTNEQKLEMMQEYYAVLDELRTRDREAEELNMERHLAIWDSAFNRNNAMKNAVNSVIDAISAYMQAEVDSGKLTEKESKRKQKALENLQKVQLAVTIANIAANTAGSIIDVWRGYAAELPVNAATAAATGPAAAATKMALDGQSLAAAILRTGTLSMEGTAQIAAAVGGYISKSKASSMEAGGESTGVGVVPATIDSTPYSYTRTVQTEEDVDMMNQRPLFVTVTDIMDGLENRKVQVTETSF